MADYEGMWGALLSTEPNGPFDQVKLRAQVAERPEALFNSSSAYFPYFHQNVPWAILRSGVDVNEDGRGYVSDLSRRKVLLAGTTDSTLSPSSLASQYSFNVNNEYGGEFTYDVDDNMGFRPAPGITDISVKTRDTWGCIMEAEVKLKVWSLKDLQAFSYVYFRPGFSALLEWGHSVALVKSNNEPSILTPTYIPDNDWFRLKDGKGTGLLYFDEEIKKRRQSYAGNYEGICGYITNFNYSLQKNGSYDCSVKVMGRGSLLLNVTSPETRYPNEKDDGDELQVTDSFRQALKHYIAMGINDEGNIVKVSKKTGSKSYHFVKFSSLLQVLNQTCQFAEVNSKGFVTDTNYRFVSFEGMQTLRPDVLIIPKDPGKDPEITEAEVAGVAESLVKDRKEQLDNLGKGKQETDKTVDPLTAPERTDAIQVKPIPGDMSVVAPGKEAEVAKSILEGLRERAKSRPFVWYGDTNIMSLVESINKNSRWNLFELLQHPEGFYGHADQDTGWNVIGNLMVCLEWVLSCLDSVSDEGRSKWTVESLMNTVLSDMNSALGNVCDLDLYVSNNRLYIIDRNNIEDTQNRNKQSTSSSLGDVKIPLTGIRSTLSSLEVSSGITNNMANEMSIAAQAPVNRETSSIGSLIVWNAQCKDRWAGKGDVKGRIDDDSIPEIAGEFLRNLSILYREWVNGADKQEDTTDTSITSTVESMGSQIYQFIMRQIFLGKLKPGSYVQHTGVLPIKLSMTMKGISRFIIGTCFSVEDGILPSQYHDWGFIITGVEHSIGRGGWTTNIKTQYYPVGGLLSKAVGSTGTRDTRLATESYTPPEKLNVEPYKDNTNSFNQWLANNAVSRVEHSATCEGQCAKGTAKLVSVFRNPNQKFRNLTDSVGAGNADSPEYVSFLIRNGYSKVDITGNKRFSTADIKTYLSNCTFKPGDVLIYEGAGKTRDHGYHTCFYIGDNPTNSAGRRWISDGLQNGPFVYGGGSYSARRVNGRVTESGWKLIIMRAPTATSVTGTAGNYKVTWK